MELEHADLDERDDSRQVVDVEVRGRAAAALADAHALDRRHSAATCFW